MAIKPNVIDIYHGDAVASFSDAAAAGIVGVIHKTTTGATGHDEKYAERRNPAIDAGLLWGAYHWGTHANVADQVDNFLTRAAPDENTLVALDYEPTEGNQMTLGQAQEFLETIEQRLGRKAVIYSGHLLKQDLGNSNNVFFGAHRLWLAQYGDTPVVQKSWATYWLWQYTDGRLGPDEKKVDGVPGNHNGELDCDFFNGTTAELRAQWAS